MTDRAFCSYATRLSQFLVSYDWSALLPLAESLRNALGTEKAVYICGNGGSAANAIHFANDYLYGIAKETGRALRVEALSSNVAVLTCLANDVGYDEIFAGQLMVKARAGDILIVLSGSGESANVVRALAVGRELRMQTFALVGFSGGQCKSLADNTVHFQIDDMQMCEDLHSIAGHMLMQVLSKSQG